MAYARHDPFCKETPDADPTPLAGMRPLDEFWLYICDRRVLDKRPQKTFILIFGFPSRHATVLPLFHDAAFENRCGHTRRLLIRSSSHTASCPQAFFVTGFD